MEVFMKTILTIAAASALFSFAGYAAAEPANADHASHNHAAPTAPAAPTPTPAPDQNAMNCSSMMKGGAPQSGGMGAMPGMADKPGASMDHQHMMSADMKGCEHMMHGTATPSPAPSSTPKQ